MCSAKLSALTVFVNNAEKLPPPYLKVLNYSMTAVILITLPFILLFTNKYPILNNCTCLQMMTNHLLNNKQLSSITWNKVFGRILIKKILNKWGSACAYKKHIQVKKRTFKANLESFKLCHDNLMEWKYQKKIKHKIRLFLAMKQNW